MTLTYRSAVRKSPTLGNWIASAEERRPSGTISGEVAASYPTHAEAMAEMPGLLRDLAERTPHGPDLRGPAADPVRYA